MPAPPPHESPDAEALSAALRAVLVPLARLAVARGVPFAAVEQALKQAFVDAARAVHGPSALPHRMVSRIATATGLSRREVTRLTQGPADTHGASAPPSLPRTHATEVFTRWMSDPQYRGKRGPRELPRLGEAPSFETLAQSVTRDVHSRSLLDELIRLGLASHDVETDRVSLVRDAFVPRGDTARMLGFLGANVGDHLAGAVDNVLGSGARHFEQALFANGLPAAAVEQLHDRIAEQWKQLRASIAPELERMIEDERRAGGPGLNRMRIGLYTYEEGGPMPADAPPARPRRIRSRES